MLRDAASGYIEVVGRDNEGTFKVLAYTFVWVIFNITILH